MSSCDPESSLVKITLKVVVGKNTEAALLQNLETLEFDRFSSLAVSTCPGLHFKPCVTIQVDGIRKTLSDNGEKQPHKGSPENIRKEVKIQMTGWPTCSHTSGKHADQQVVIDVMERSSQMDCLQFDVCIPKSYHPWRNLGSQWSCPKTSVYILIFIIGAEPKNCCGCQKERRM